MQRSLSECVYMCEKSLHCKESIDIHDESWAKLASLSVYLNLGFCLLQQLQWLAQRCLFPEEMGTRVSSSVRFCYLFNQTIQLLGKKFQQQQQRLACDQVNHNIRRTFLTTKEKKSSKQNSELQQLSSERFWNMLKYTFVFALCYIFLVGSL